MVDPARTTVLVVDAEGADAELWCGRLDALLDDGHDLVLCDVAALTAPGPATLDLLARLQLRARRRGRQVRLRSVGTALEELLELAGLAGVLPCGDASVAGVLREPEDAEQVGVEEGRHPGDAAS